MNFLKQALVHNLSSRHVLVLRQLKRWIMREPPLVLDPTSSVTSSGSGHSPPFDVSASVPPGIFQRRPIQEWRSAQGTFFLPVDASRDAEAIAIRSGEILEPGIASAAKKYISAGTVVIEIGAGFGQLSVLFSSMVGEEGQVLAFEADEYVFDILLRNAHANRIGNIRAFLGAAYDGSRAEVFFPEKSSSYRSRRSTLEASGGRAMGTLMIDHLGIQAPVSFMHVHAPGREIHALRGAEETIRRFRMPIAIEFDGSSEFDSAPPDLIAFL